jgi:putative tricarboxylic transport membrane protein
MKFRTRSWRRWACIEEIAVITNLAHGFVQVFQPFDLLMLFIGLLVGMAVSIMPGLGLVMGVVLALPFTYRMEIEPSVILLTAIYFSGTYAGCFSAILYRIPGEPMDVPMLWDGYTMAKRGEPAKALGWALVAALIGGLVSSVVMVALAGPMSEIALKFDSPDYFAAVFFGLTTVVALAGKSMVNSVISLCVGLLVATVGIDSIYGTERFAFGVPVLRDGVQLVEVLVGMYGLGEILSRIGQGLRLQQPKNTAKKVATQFPTLRELVAIRITLLRSTIIGTLLGIVPGAGATITAFISYGIEKQYGRRRHLLGTGLPEGIVAPQIGATASVAGHMMPLLTLGLPGSGATAVILAAFLLHGVQPGPMLFEDPASSLMVYTILASMFASVIGMCLLGFFWIRVVIKVLTIPQGVLSAIVVMFCLVGAYANRNNMSDVWMIVIFGVLGYLFEKFSFPIAPMVLGAILGPIGETSFMRGMISSGNDWTVFFTGPICGTLMVASFMALSYPLLREYWSTRRRTQVAA